MNRNNRGVQQQKHQQQQQQKASLICVGNQPDSMTVASNLF